MFSMNIYQNVWNLCLLDYRTIGLLLCLIFYIKIGLLLYLMFSINTLTNLLEYKRPCTVGLLDYWTIGLSLCLYSYMYQNMGLCLLDYWIIRLLLCLIFFIMLFTCYVQYNYLDYQTIGLQNSLIVQQLKATYILVNIHREHVKILIKQQSNSPIVQQYKASYTLVNVKEY